MKLLKSVGIGILVSFVLIVIFYNYARGYGFLAYFAFIPGLFLAGVSLVVSIVIGLLLQANKINPNHISNKIMYIFLGMIVLVVIYVALEILNLNILLGRL